MADLFDRFGNRVSVATTSDLQSTDIGDLSDISVDTPLQGQFLVYNETDGVWENLDVHDGIDLHDQTKAYSANEVVVKDNVIYAANDAIPADTAFSEGESGATWRVIGSTGGVQPTVETIDGASGTVSLDVDNANWFNVEPTGDVTLEFSLTEQDEGRFDLVWTNLESVISSSAYDLDNTTYDNVSFSVSGQEITPYGLEFSPDGLRMVVVGFNSTRVYQYDLSTAFDLSTASYNNVNLNVSSLDSIFTGVTFSNDGTKLYVVGLNTSSIYQYSLTTPFDIDTATYDSVSFAAGDEAPFTQGARLSNDGSKLFVLGSQDENIYQYSLGTLYEIDTATYDNISFDPTAQALQVTGFSFSTDGDILFIVDDNLDIVHRYDLDSPFDLSSVTYSNASIDVSAQDVDVSSAVFNNDGTKMFVLGRDNDSVYQYTSGEIVTGPQAELTFPDSVEWAGGTPPTLGALGEEDWFRFETKDGGTVWYGDRAITADSSEQDREIQPVVDSITGADGPTTLAVDNFNWFNVTPSGDVELDFNLTTQNEGRFDLVWENASSGTVTNGYVFDSATQDSQLDVSNEIDGTLYGVNVGGPNSEFIYAAGSDSSGNAKIAQYLMTTPGDLSTATLLRDDVSPAFIGYFTVEFNSDGTKMFVTDTDSSLPSIHEWNLGTPWNLSSLAFQDSWGLAVEGGLTRSASLLFAPDGLTIYVSDFNNPGIVYELDSGQPFDLGDITYSGVSYDLGVGSGRLSGLEFNSDGTKLFALADGVVHRFTLSTPYDLSTATNDNVTLSVDTSDFRFTADGINLYSADLASKTISQYSTSEQAPGPLAQLTFADTIEWSSGSEPALSTTDGAKDWFKFETKDGGTTWYGELFAGEAATTPATQAYVDDKITNWTSLSTRWDTEPALDSTIAEGDVYTYTLDGTTRYRLVPDPYSAENDAFYATFSGGVLSDLITKRNDPL